MYPALVAQATNRLRAMLGRKRIQKQPKPLIRYRVNIRVSGEENNLLLINHSFFVMATCEDHVLMHPRVGDTCTALNKLGYTADIHVIPFPAQPFLSDEDSCER